MESSRQAKLRSVWVIIAAALLLEVATAVQYYATRDGITHQLTEMAQHDIIASNNIAKLKKDVEMAVEKVMPQMQRLFVRHDTDSVRIVVRQILKDNPEIVGVDFCITKGKKGKPAGIYIFKEDDENIVAREIDFDFTKRSWYSEGLKSNGFWSEPYKSNYKVIWMSTFSQALYDSRGNAVAVLGADVPLSEISSVATQLYDKQHRTLHNILLLHIFGLAALGFLIYHSLRSASKLQDEKAEKERIKGELDIARGIQQAMLPKIFPPYPERTDVDIYASLTPAREVGGDFYDFLIRDEKLFFCIGDVSGKGVPAALVMAVARSMFRMLAAREAAPERIVKSMNDAIASDNDYNMFITLFLGVLDLPTGRLRYCNAGHPAPLLDATPMKVDANLPVGTFTDIKYSGQEIIISPDSTLFLYTDGLNEAENKDDELFGKERVIEVCSKVGTVPTSESQSSSIVTPRQFIENMTDAVHRFVGSTEQSDDLTMLAIKYTRQSLDAQFSCSITLHNDVNEVSRLNDFVESVCLALGLSGSVTMQIVLAIEEAVVNVMNYAYPQGIQGEVKIEAVASEERLKFIIIDSGKPFDPTTRGEVDTSLPAEERSIGGLGIHLMRRYMDSINYERVDGKNILTLRKDLDINDIEQ